MAYKWKALKLQGSSQKIQDNNVKSNAILYF